MPQNSDQVAEQIIVEALRREIERVSPPPADHMWLQISTRLKLSSGVAARAKRPSPPWQKVAVGVAAMLLLVAGVAGLYRSLQPLSKGFDLADSNTFEESGDCLTVAEREEGDGEMGPVGQGRAEDCQAACLEPPTGSDPDCLLKTEYELPEDGNTGLQAARYTGSGVELIWIKKEPPADSLQQLLLEVERLFSISARVLTESEQGLILEDSAGNLGLAIRDGLSDRLLLVKEGQFTENELWNIFAGLNEP